MSSSIDESLTLADRILDRIEALILEAERTTSRSKWILIEVNCLNYS